jgi:hypothetical protein
MKQKTTYQLLKNLIEELKNDHITCEILRQQILEISEDKTREIINNRKKYENFFIAPSMFIELNKLVIKTIGYAK